MLEIFIIIFYSDTYLKNVGLFISDKNKSTSNKEKFLSYIKCATLGIVARLILNRYEKQSNVVFALVKCYLDKHIITKKFNFILLL